MPLTEEALKMMETPKNIITMVQEVEGGYPVRITTDEETFFRYWVTPREDPGGDAKDGETVAH